MLDSGSADEEDYTVALDIVLDRLEGWAAESVKKRKKIKQFLGMKDGASGRSVIHLAASKWGSKVVRQLLDLGANIGEVDHSGEVAVTSISPDLLETVLDTKWSPEKGDPDVEDYKIKFNFQFLQCDKEDMAPAMQTLMAISESKPHRKLLAHPVLATFLALQWNEFSVFYNLNTFVTFLHCLFVNLFILRNYGGSSLAPLSLYSDWASCDVENFPGALSGADSCLQVFWWITLLFSLAMVARELTQAVAHLANYFCSLENWTEITFLTSTFVLLALSSTAGQPVCHMRALAATILLLSWVIFFGLVGRHPNIQHHNVYITMFFKVMKRFVKIFLAFMPYIIALGLFFYISLHQDGIERTRKESTTIAGAETDERNQQQLLVRFDELQQKHKKEILEKIDEKGDFMNRVGFSVLKSMAMFVGELEFSDIRFENMPYFSHVSFFFFVILFVVVLMNYLTGIAVEVTREIEQEAEVLTQRMRTRTLFQLSTIMHKFGRPALFSWKSPEKVEVQVRGDGCCFWLSSAPLLVLRLLLWCWTSQHSWRSVLLVQAKQRREMLEQARKVKQEQVEVIKEAVKKVLEDMHLSSSS